MVKKKGRPTVYRTEFAGRARDACFVGATNERLAELFKVNISTIEDWLRDKEDFSRAVNEGREGADERVANALYRKACGYDLEKVKYIDGKEVVEIVHYPPDTGAAAMWLKNRQRKHWKDWKAVEHSGPDGGAIQTIAVEFIKSDIDEKE